MTHEQEVARVAYHTDLAQRDEPVAIAWEQLDSREQHRYIAIATSVITAHATATDDIGIITERRSGSWAAHLGFDHGTWTTGKTEAEAIGNLWKLAGQRIIAYARQSKV